MDEQRQEDQWEPTYNSFVLIQEDLLESMDEREGGMRGSGKSALVVWHGDDDQKSFLFDRTVCRKIHNK